MRLVQAFTAAIKVRFPNLTVDEATTLAGDLVLTADQILKEETS